MPSVQNFEVPVAAPAIVKRQSDFRKLFEYRQDEWRRTAEKYSDFLVREIKSAIRTYCMDQQDFRD